MTVQTYYTLTCNDCSKMAKTLHEGVRPLNWGGPWRYRSSRYGEDYCPECTRKRLEKDWPEGVPMPEVGQEIYIKSSYYIDHGEDDVDGGLAHIERIEYNPGCKNPINRVMVKVREVDGHQYNYFTLMGDQDKLRADYGDREAKNNPDLDENGYPNRY
jgi:hypothetical protein